MWQSESTTRSHTVPTLGFWERFRFKSKIFGDCSVRMCIQTKNPLTFGKVNYDATNGGLGKVLF